MSQRTNELGWLGFCKKPVRCGLVRGLGRPTETVGFSPVHRRLSLRGYDTQQQKEVYVYAAGRQSSVEPASRPNYVCRVVRVRVEYSGGAGRFGLSEKKNGLARVG